MKESKLPCSSSSSSSGTTTVTYYCPICLCSPEEVYSETNNTITFCQSPCRHEFCLPCVEKFLLKPPKREMIQNVHDYYQHRPTTGTCPICRQVISLFDLKKKKTNNDDDDDGYSSYVYPKIRQVDTWPIHNRSYEQQNYHHERQRYDLLKFIRQEGPLNGYGIRFEFINGQAKMIFPTIPTSSQQQKHHHSHSKLPNNGVLILEDCHFFEKTMTFHANYKFPSSSSCYYYMTQPNEHIYNELECMLQFSRDGQFVRDGYIRWKLKDDSNDDNDNHKKEYPLDGTWKAFWKFGITMDIHVQNHCFAAMDHWYEIEWNETNHYRPRFLWSEDNATVLNNYQQEQEQQRVVQTSTISIPPGSNKGPKVGEILEWKTTYPTVETVQWTRLSMDLSNAWKLVRMNPKEFVYRQIPHNNNNPNNNSNPNSPVVAQRRPTYHGDSIWGNTFCQAFCIGLASYHFERRQRPRQRDSNSVNPFENPANAAGTSSSHDDDDDTFYAYISYEHPRTASWPTLDDGTAVPPQVPFSNISWNASTRTFRGEICWLELYQTKWQGEAKWKYEMQFDTRFMYISGGSCSRQQEEGTSSSMSSHLFGVDLVYVNAAMEEPLRNIIMRETTNSTSNDIFGMASIATNEMLRHVVLNQLAGRPSLFDFNLLPQPPTTTTTTTEHDDSANSQNTSGL